jgi:hypothetical protein
MDEKLGKSLDTLLALSSRHCFRFRLADYDFTPIPSAELRQLASSMLDHFEDEMERLRTSRGTADTSNAPSGNDPEGAASPGVSPRRWSHRR